MPNQYVNKVVFNGDTLIDLTADTVDAAHLLSGYTAHDASGALVSGACAFNADTSDATAAAGEILSGKTAYVGGSQITGTMPNIGSQTSTISSKAQVVSISAGYHDGSGTVQIASTEQAKIIATNIRQNVTILGVTGSMSGSESVHAQSKTKTYTPTAAIQTETILPDSPSYNYLSQVEVTIAAIPYNEADNPAGGRTVSIG